MDKILLHLPKGLILEINQIFDEESILYFGNHQIDITKIKPWKKDNLKQVVLELLYDLVNSEESNIHSAKLKKHRIKIDKKIVYYSQIIDFIFRYGLITKNDKYSVNAFTKSYFVKSELKHTQITKFHYRKSKIKYHNMKKVIDEFPNTWNLLRSVELSEPTDEELDFLKLDKKRWDRCQLLRVAIDKKELFFSRGDDRLYHSIATMPKELRKSLRLNGERLVELDMRAAAPTLMANLIGYQPFIDFMIEEEDLLWESSCRNNWAEHPPVVDPYEKIAQRIGYTRDFVKEEFQLLINNGSASKLFLTTLEELVPGVLDEIAKWKIINPEPWVTLFKLESELILNFAEENGVLPLHDALIVPEKRAREIHLLFRAHLKKNGIKGIVKLPKGLLKSTRSLVY